MKKKWLGEFLKDRASQINMENNYKYINNKSSFPKAWMNQATVVSLFIPKEPIVISTL